MFFAVPTLTATNQSVTLLVNQSVTLECIPSNPLLEVKWYFIRDRSTFPLFNEEAPDEGNPDQDFSGFPDQDYPDQVKKRNVIVFNNVVSESPYHQIILKQVEVTDSGQYRCVIQQPPGDSTIIEQFIDVTVLPG